MSPINDSFQNDFPYKIREFNGAPSDAKQLEDLFIQFGEYMKAQDKDDLDLLVVPKDYGEQSQRKLVDEVKKHNGVIYLLEGGGEISGFAAGIVREVGNEPGDDCKPHRMGRLLELFIKEERRGQGLGRFLMQRMIDFFKGKKCYKVNVEVFAPNESAYRFYEKFGFKQRNYDLVKVMS